MEVVQLIDTFYKTHDLIKQAERFVRDPSLLPGLVEVAVSELPHPYPESASWILTHMLGQNTHLLVDFQPVFIDRILTSKNQSVLRNLTHIAAELPFIEYRESELLERLLSFISDPHHKVALFVYGLYKLIQFTKKYPELKTELDAILEKRSSGGLTPAMRIGIRNYRKETR